MHLFLRLINTLLKKRITISLFLVIPFIIFSKNTTHVNSKVTIVNIGAFNYYPGIFKDKDDKVKGFIVDILQEIARLENWELNFEYGSWNSGLEKIKNNKLDLLTSVAFTPERAKYLDYSNSEILTVWSEVYSKDKSKIQGILDLKGKKIALMKGDFNGQSLINLINSFHIKCQIIELENFESVFKEISSGNVDAGVVNNTYGVAKHEDFNLISSGIVFNPFKIHFTVAKGSNKELLQTIDSYLSKWKVQKDSPYYKAIESWSYKNANLIQVIPNWLVTMLGLLFSFLLVAALFIFMLRKRVKIATDNVIKSEKKFSVLFQKHSAAMLLIDPDSKNIIDANDAASNFYGWPIEELKSMNISLINTLDSDEINNEMGNALSSGKTNFLFKHRKANGSICDVEVYSSKITTAGKIYLHSIVHDVTEKKKAEEELIKHRLHLEELVEERTEEIDAINKELMQEIARKENFEKQLQNMLEKEKELVRLKSRFISTASHEFRTPLSTILSSAELIQRFGKKWSDEKFIQYIDRITNSVDYLTGLMDDVLMMSRIESDKLVLSPAKINLHELCLTIIDDYKIKLNSNQSIALEYSAESDIYNFDPKQLSTILQNLISNAIKYSPEGGKIIIKVSTSVGFVNFEVIDEGIGIPKQDMPRLFEPFHRSINAENIQGTGLGLSIVKSAVDLHNGIITVYSEIGKGTTFTVQLPVA